MSARKQGGVRKGDKRSSSRVPRSESEYRMESTVIKKGGDAPKQSSYIDIEVDEADVIQELKQTRQATFQVLDPVYTKSLDEYVEKRSSGKATTKRNGTLSHQEPERVTVQKPLVPVEKLKDLLERREDIESVDPNVPNLDFDRFVRQTTDYTDLFFHKPDYLGKDLLGCFLFLNGMGWDIINVRDDAPGSSIMDNGVEFVHSNATYCCFHFTYFGDIVKPSRSRVNMESFNPAMDTMPQKLLVFSSDGTSEVRTHSCPFDFLLYIKKNKEVTTGTEAVHFCIINTGVKIK